MKVRKSFQVAAPYVPGAMFTALTGRAVADCHDIGAAVAQAKGLAGHLPANGHDNEAHVPHVLTPTGADLNKLIDRSLGLRA